MAKLYEFLNKNEGLKSYTIFDSVQIEIDLSKPAERAIPFNAYESLITKKIQEIIKENNVVIDIGAWIGYYTLLVAKKVGPKGKIIAIEPHYKNFQRIKKNVELNKFSNVSVLNLAVSNKTGNATLIEQQDGSCKHKITYDDTGQTKLETLDNIRVKSGLSKINLIIMDIEGYEFLALKGLVKSLSKKNIKNIICEIHPKQLAQNNITVAELISFIESCDYELSIIDKKGRDSPYHVLLTPKE